MISPDGTAAICAREPSIRPLGAAGWLHKLDGTSLEADTHYNVPPPEYVATQKPAGPEQRNEVYRALLDHLKLSKVHSSALAKRGLPEETLAYNQYKTLPDGDRVPLTAKVKGEVVGVSGVPGFYLNDRGVPSLAGAPGLLIPIRDHNQLIVALQVRRDTADNGGKYVWLSSYDKRRGVGSGSPAHVAVPAELKTADVVVITEGALKADIIAHFVGCPVVGVGGVAAWRMAVEATHHLKPRKVVVAYDNDQMQNEVVYRHAKDLEKALLFHHYYVYEAVWHADFKGLDDYLASGAGKLGFKAVKAAPALIKRPYKEQGANSYNYAWAHVNALKANAPHITGPDCHPPFAFGNCECECCQASRKYTAEVVADVLLEVAT